ncbi:MAG: ABC transporter permease [Dehalococcoidia bacterium]
MATSFGRVEEAVLTIPPRRRKSPLQRFWFYLQHKPLGTFGFAIMAIIIIVGIFATWLAPHPFAFAYYDDAQVAPSLEYPMGTDRFGRDIFSRIIHGARISLQVGFLATMLGTGVGAVLGLVSGYLMGKFDMILQRFLDMLMSFPDLILALVIVAVLGQNLIWVIVAIAVTILPRGVRVVRSSTISLREMDFVTASRAIGASNRRIILRHIAPNTVAPFLIIMSAMFGTAILTEAGLSFLGLGVPEPYPSWGRMLAGDAAVYAETAPWMVIFPGLAITITVLGFAFAGDALRDILDPRLRGR